MISVDVDAVGLQFSVKVSRNLFSFDRFNPVFEFPQEECGQTAPTINN